MEDMEGNKFEDKWKAAVAGAEVQPSDSVWSSVESELIVAENQKMKHQVVFYQRLAAACIIFALLLGAVGFYYGINSDESLVAAFSTNQSNPVVQAIPKGESGEEKNLIPDNNTLKESVKLLPGKSVVEKMVTFYRHNNNPPRLVNPDSAKNVSVETASAPPANTTLSTDRADRKNLTAMQIAIAVRNESPIKIQKQKEESIELDGLTKTANLKETVEIKPEKYSEHLWASLGLSAGNYNPGFISSNYSVSALGSPGNPNYQGSSTNRPAVGTSYSVGLALGKRVAARWIIQGGINYLNQNSGYTSDITTAPSSSNQAQAFDLYNVSVKAASSVTFTNPYQINSTLEFISIPVQAGYLLVDRKMGFQMNAGIATDFFIRNSLADQSGQAKSYSQGAGSNSPYRSVNWAGLVSTELSYKVGRQYRVSLVPGVRYLFNSALKSGATSNSYVADIGFRFRYILK